MARTSRIVLPDHPHHIVHRGHNRHPVFFSEADRKSYLSNLAELKEEHGCRVFAYCLMTNHVHLVIDPGPEGERLSELIQRLAIRHTMRINKKHGRSGTLWEGRFRSSPIRSDRYLLACCRYVELNPLRVGMVRLPYAYRWSSCRARSGMAGRKWLDEDHCYRGLGRTDVDRQRAYRRIIMSTLDDEEVREIRRAIHRGRFTESTSDMPAVSDNIGLSPYRCGSEEGLSLM